MSVRFGMCAFPCSVCAVCQSVCPVGTADGCMKVLCGQMFGVTFDRSEV